MRKIIFLLFTLLLASCGTLVPSSQSNGESKTPQRVIDGKWTLESVTYNQKEKYEITLLNDTSKDCFEGSVWEFAPENNRGTYRINHNDCSVGERNFVFVIQNKDRNSGYYEFSLKPTDEKYQSETSQGVVFQLVHLSGRTMIWEQTLKVDGKHFVISMNFVK